jgi:hypothetical protein
VTGRRRARPRGGGHVVLETGRASRAEAVSDQFVGNDGVDLSESGWAAALARIEARLGPVALKQVQPLDYGGEHQ